MKKIILFPALAISLAYLVFVIIFFNWVIDDLYIYFRYAKNFAGGNGISFNPGEFVEGFSSFAWFMIISFYELVSFPVELSAKITSVTFALLNFAMTAMILFRQKMQNQIPIALAVTSLNVPFIIWSVSGFEIMFYIFLTLTAFNLASREMRGVFQQFMFAALLFLIAVTRPEGILFSIALLVYCKVSGIDRKPFFIILSVFAVLMFLFLLFRYFYFGDLLPNTYFAKLGHELTSYYSFRTYKNGFFYILDFFIHNPQFLLIALTVIALGRKLLRNKFLAFSFLMIILQFAFVIFSGGDWMIQYRFIVPAIPFMSLLIAGSLGEFKVHATIGSRAALAMNGLAAALILFSLASADYATIRKETILWNNVKSSGDDMSKLIQPGSTVAVGSAGIIPYELEDVTFIDMVGLTNKHIARFGTRRGTWFERSLPDYVYSRNPGWLIMWKRKNASGIYTFARANPGYLDMAVHENFDNYALEKYYDVYDEDRIELYKLKK